MISTRIVSSTKKNICMLYRNSKILSRALLIFFAVTIISGCNQTRVYDISSKISEANWPTHRAKAFEVEIDDTLTYHNINISLRNQIDYQYRNLYLFVNTQLPNGVFTRDTIDCILANFDGKWIGDGIGSTRSIYIPFRESILFPRKGKYTFFIEQAMRCDTLKGISDVGIRIDKVLIED